MQLQLSRCCINVHLHKLTLGALTGESNVDLVETLAFGNDVYLLSLQAKIDEGDHIADHILGRAECVRPLVIVEQFRVDGVDHHLLAVEDYPLPCLLPLDLAIDQGAPAISVKDLDDIFHAPIPLEIEEFEAFDCLEIRNENINMG